VGARHTGVSVHSLLRFFITFRARPKLFLFVIFVAAANQFTFTAMAAAPSAGRVHQQSAVSECSGAGEVGPSCAPVSADGLQLSVPDGAEQCPASGEGASCVTNGGAGDSAPGVASTPDGQTACPGGTGSALTTPAACSDVLLSGGSSSSDNTGAPADNPSVAPSVPISSLRPAASVQTLTLTSSTKAIQSGGKVVLTATSGSGVSGTGKAIQIFDTTAGKLLGSCSKGGQCAVAYAAKSGVHNFVAYLGVPSATAPSKSALSSNTVSIGWIGLSLTSVQPAVGPGKPATLTATTTIPVEQFGYAIELFDLSNMNRITFCSRGTNCSVSLTQPASGTRSIVAAVGKPTTTFSNPDIWAVSDHLSVAWLSIAIGGSSTFQVGSTIHLTASTNADLTNTPWSIGIFDDQGRLVAAPCKKGNTCTAEVAAPGGSTPQFTAAIGAVPATRNQTKIGQLLQKVTGPTTLVDIQARSSAIQPSRLLWGVDSCKAFTGDPTGEVLPGVQETIGNPDFWGRYLTSTVCPGLSWQEIYTAAKMRMGILPIYNDYNCSAVSGYNTGMGYAQVATSVAAHDTEPKGHVIAVDIEPPGAACPGAGNVDSGFIRGWYDGVTAAGYVPVFYGNGTAGSEFGAAWCQAQSEQKAISWNAYIWSFEPSLDSSGWSKANAPVWQPNETGCPDHLAAWQYQLGSNSPDPNVDADEALSILPLWYPTNTP
jgi:hypothetical protein